MVVDGYDMMVDDRALYVFKVCLTGMMASCGFD
jgi:hypothetical protein